MTDDAEVWSPPSTGAPRPPEETERVLACPNPDCPHRQRHGAPAEYRVGTARCRDCGAALDVAPRAQEPPPIVAVHGLGTRWLVTLAAAATLLMLAGAPLVIEQASLLGGAPAVLARLGKSGVMVLVTGALLMEALLAITPGERRLRRAGPRARGKVAALAVIAALALALARARSLDVAFEGASTPIDRAALYWAACGGTAASAALTWLVTTKGLGHGMSLALGVFAGSTLVVQLVETPPEQAPMALALIGVIALVTAYLASHRGALGAAAPPVALAIPAPAALAGALWSIDTVASWAGMARPELVALTAEPWTLLVATLSLALLQARPRALARVAARATGDATAAVMPAARAAARTAVARSCGLAMVMAVGQEVSVRAELELSLGLVVVVTAVVMDLVREDRFRRRAGALASAWPLQQPYAVEPIVAALRAQGIEAHARGVVHRALLGVLGPFVPIDVLVAPAQVARAQAIIADALEGPAPPVAR